MRALGRFAVVVVLAGLGLAVGLSLLAPAARDVFTAGAAEETPLADLTPREQRSVVYARDRSVLAVLHSEVNRQPVRLEQVPQVLVDAILDVEDARFRTHNGVDLRGTLRALYTNVSAGGVEQGGSTITQQLVKNLLLTPKRDAGRKVKEAVLAIRLEKKLSKQEILGRYLNTVYFGNGAYGVQAAAERYFGIDVGDVTVAQAALLAGVIRNPLGYDPFVNADAARDRRDFALRRLLAEGHVNQTQYREALAQPLPQAPRDVLPGQDGGTGYFVEEVKRRLLRDTRLGETASERYNAVFNGGLEIHTTLDPRLERAALEHVAAIVPDTGGRFTAALVAVEPATGAVRALVGGPGFESAKFNLATQGRRQAGSVFKIFALVAALERGESPSSTIDSSSPCRIPNPGGTPDPWEPQNSEGEGHGFVSLTDATAHSINCAYARLALLVGVDKIEDVAKRMGIVTPLEPTPAMTLGGLRNGVTPLEMGSAYATLAADGVHHAPYFVERVLDRDGKEILRDRRDGERVVSAQDARVATQMLQQVVRRGTGTAARVPGWEVAGKTGTAQEHVDAWFVGYTRRLATSVWMGAPVGEVPMRNVGGRRVFGGTYPARIWSAFMTDALRGVEPEAFPKPNPRLIPRGTTLTIEGDRPVETSTTTSTTIEGDPSASTTTTRPLVDDPRDPTTTSPSRPPTTGEPPPPTTEPPPPPTDPPPPPPDEQPPPREEPTPTTRPPPDDEPGDTTSTTRRRRRR